MAIHKFLTLGLIINYEVVAVVVAVVRVEIFFSVGAFSRKTNKKIWLADIKQKLRGL